MAPYKVMVLWRCQHCVYVCWCHEPVLTRPVVCPGDQQGRDCLQGHTMAQGVLHLHQLQQDAIWREVHIKGREAILRRLLRSTVRQEVLSLHTADHRWVYNTHAHITVLCKNGTYWVGVYSLLLHCHFIHWTTLNMINKLFLGGKSTLNFSVMTPEPFLVTPLSNDENFPYGYVIFK